MVKIITLEIGNTSWWKDKKYRKEAAQELRRLRNTANKIKLEKKYRIDGSNTILYADYLII